MRRRLAALAGAVFLFAASATTAFAHEERQVGKYTLEVGWRDEPALEGVMNAVELDIHETATRKRVERLTRTLRVLVSFGGLSQTFEPTLRAVHGEAGAYLGDLIPTTTGDYTFRVVGTIEDLKVDERFESGPGRFDPVRAPDTLQFPDRIGGPGATARELRSLSDQIQVWRVVALVAATTALASTGLAIASLRRTRR